MTSMIAAFAAAVLLLLTAACSGSNDEELDECIGVLVDVATDHFHPEFDGLRSSTNNFSMPRSWFEDRGIEIDRSLYDVLDDFVDEKCAPFLR